MIGRFIPLLVALLSLFFLHSLAVKPPSSSINLKNQGFRSTPSNIFEPDGDSLHKKNYDERSVSDFRTASSRKGFIRKVYAIFGSQVATTVLMTAVIMRHPPLAKYLQMNYQSVALMSFLSSMAAVLGLVLHPSLRYTAPFNFMALALFAIAQSIMIGTFAR